MSIIRTIKGQTDEYLGNAGLTITEWPGDFPLVFLFPFDEGDAVPQTCFEVMSNDTVTTPLSNTLDNNTDVGGFIDNVFNYVSMPEDQSFTLFYFGDFPAAGSFFEIGTIGAGRIAATVNPATSLSFSDSNGAVGTTVGDVFTASATDQLCNIIVNRSDNTVMFYEGSTGETLIASLSIAADGVWTQAGSTLQMQTGNPWLNCYGIGMVKWANGVPSNHTAIMQAIQAEMKTAKKREWIGNFVENYLL